MSAAHGCRHCGFGIPADAPVCPGCSRPAIDDWRRRARAARSVERQARRVDPPLHESGYRSLLRTALVSRALLGTAAAAGVVTAALHAGSATTATATERSPGLSLTEAARWSTLALLVLVGTTGLAFVGWAVRAYRNLPALGITDRRYWTVWLVVGWVVPGANLLVPKLVIDDIWRASSPSLPIGAGDGWQRRPVASLVNRWWCSLLLGPAVVVLAAVGTRTDAFAADGRLMVAGASAVASAAVVTAAVSARRLVAVITVAQARRADRVWAVQRDAESARQHRLAMARAVA